ncbi:hypothetical protein DFH07DRAFT_1067595 [Mycena maculata]|uniref:Transmembrane protein n=1 Tax=Mycena maculata TaxID=230809 RepID=A0AAD7HIC8_9AGAR|nr:hypothetical protein DFH07DRAFT_1067595 [Mycena maculata]
MFARKTKRAALLPRDVSIEASTHELPGLREKDFDPDVLLESPLTPPRKRARRSCSKLIGWPAIVILGQVLLQVIGWGFFVVVRARGQVPLPFESAVWVADNPHLVTLLATLISTVLAGFSSFLFSYAIRRSMGLYLYRPVSLATLGASVSISMRSIVFHRRNWKWPTVSFFFFFLAGVQTSGWSTLLTPVKVIVPSPLGGSELDLSSINLLEVYNSSEYEYCVLGEGGILPVYLASADVSNWFLNVSMIPASAQSSSTPVKGLSANYTMLQQGFTADVSCSFQNLTSETTPSFLENTTRVEDWVGGWEINTAVANLTWTGIKSWCPAQNWMNVSNAFTVPTRDLMMMLACGPGPAGNYTLIFVSHGIYSSIPMSVCEVTPQITTALVDYTSGIINVVNPNMTVAVTDPMGPTGFSAVQTLFNLFTLSQAPRSNMLGNYLITVVQELGKGSDPELQNVLEPLEEFIRGVMEYSGSMFRACVSTNASFSDGIPLNMSIPTNGTLFTETLGWSYGSSTTRWVLVPGTLIAVCTICIVGIALHRHVGDLPRESNQFDPSNPLHLITAAAAGGLNNAFRGLSNEEMKKGEKLDVLLGSIPGKGPALVRADQYTPVFADAFSPRSAEEPSD